MSAFFRCLLYIIVSSTIGLYFGAPQSLSSCIGVIECRQIVEKISGEEGKPLYVRRQHYWILSLFLIHWCRLSLGIFGMKIWSHGIWSRKSMITQTSSFTPQSPWYFSRSVNTWCWGKHRIDVTVMTSNSLSLLEATEIQLSPCGILNYHIIYSLLFRYKLKDHYPISYLDNLLLPSHWRSIGLVDCPRLKIT